MTRTTVDLDDEACRIVMERYHLATKRDAVNLALRIAAADSLAIDATRAAQGSGWLGDLDELRSTRVFKGG